MSRFGPPRGTDDLLPPRSDLIRALQEAGARLAERYGYRYVETPAFEATEVFARTSGETSDVVQKEMYTFHDRAGRSLTLRPEGTAPVVRAYLANRARLPHPFKAYYLEHMWRYGRPQAGRLREFRQFGVEVLGEAGPDADVEVVALGDRFLRGVGLTDLELQLNSIGDGRCRPAYREELLAHLERNEARLRDEHRLRYRQNPLRVLDCKDEGCREVSREAPRITERLCEPCREHFEAVKEGLAEEDVKFVVTPTLVRGLDYYTRTTCEWVSPSLPEGQASVGGGGRYDGLAEVLGGPPTPGIGWALGLERVALALGAEGRPAVQPFRLDCYLVVVGDVPRERVRTVKAALREAGLATDAPFTPRPLGAQMRLADRSGARVAVILGEREAAAGTVTLRRLSDGHQEEVPLGRAAEWVRAAGGDGR